MITPYTIGYGICFIGLCVSIGFLVDAINKKKKETDEAKKTKLTGQAVGGGFGIALSIIAAGVLGYYHTQESSEYTQLPTENFNTLYKKQIADQIVDTDKGDVSTLNSLCKSLFSDDKDMLESFNKLSSSEDPGKSYYAYQSCVGAAAGISGRNVPSTSMERIKKESQEYMKSR
jgi:hypothetical protein